MRLISLGFCWEAIPWEVTLAEKFILAEQIS